MKTKMTGTIMPTAKSLRADDEYAKKVELKMAKVVKAKLSKLRYVRNGGENRYYDGEKRYAVVSHTTFEVLWFTVHHDSNGEYSMRDR